MGRILLGKAGYYLGEGEGKPGHVSPQMEKVSSSKCNVPSQNVISAEDVKVCDNNQLNTPWYVVEASSKSLSLSDKE